MRDALMERARERKKEGERGMSPDLDLRDLRLSRTPDLPPSLSSPEGGRTPERVTPPRTPEG
eukprot:567503-Rhodomonas_salina.1